MASTEFDTIVIGGGAMGSAAAYHLARAGRSVLLLEQFELAHNRGSAHGESRIFRFAYPEPAYARLAIQCKKLWHDLEADADEELLRIVGGIDIGEAAGHADVQSVAASLAATGSNYQLLDRGALAQRFPQWHLADDAIAVYSPDTGVLAPTRCIQVMAARAAFYGARVYDCEPVKTILPAPDGVRVLTDKGEYYARRLIVAAGAWSSKILCDLKLAPPLQVSQEQTVYFRPRVNAEQFRVDNFPVWIHYRAEIVYGIPMLAQEGMKIGFHHSDIFIDVDDYTCTPNQELVARLQHYLNIYLPDAAGEPFAAAPCLYTNTPDHNFIVDLVPGYAHIAIAAGFSGHGFKFAIGIGRALADLVCDGATDLEIDHLTLRRFIK